MSDTLERDEVERLLGTTLRAKAAQVVVERARFDAQRPVVSEMVELAPRRARRKLVALATAVAVAAAATGVVIVTRSGAGSQDGVVTETTTPAALVAPAWVPAGQQLWGLTTQTSHHQAFVRQLFGDEAADGTVSSGLLVDFKHAAKLRAGFPDERLQPGTRVVVRGQHGVSRSVLDANIRTTEIEWIEGDTDLTVTVQGMALDAAVLVLDALSPRGSDLMAGFDLAEGSSFRLLGQDLGVNPASGIDASFEYSAITPDGKSGSDYSVRSSSSGGLASYLRVWMLGHREADGTTVDNELDWGVTVVWPDGRQITTQGNPPDRDPAVLERIARSATALDDGPAAALAAQARARVAALPLLGTATLPSGEIEVRGTTAPVALCLRVNGSEPACSEPFGSARFILGAGANARSAVIPPAGSAVIAGKWYVFAAAPGVPSFTAGASAPRGTPLHAETGTVDGIHVGLTVVPDGVDLATALVVIQPNSVGGTAFRRPDASSGSADGISS